MSEETSTQGQEKDTITNSLSHLKLVEDRVVIDSTDSGPRQQSVMSVGAIFDQTTRCEPEGSSVSGIDGSPGRSHLISEEEAALCLDNTHPVSIPDVGAASSQPSQEQHGGGTELSAGVDCTDATPFNNPDLVSPPDLQIPASGSRAARHDECEKVPSSQGAAKDTSIDLKKLEENAELILWKLSEKMVGEGANLMSIGLNIQVPGNVIRQKEHQHSFDITRQFHAIFLEHCKARPSILDSFTGLVGGIQRSGYRSAADWLTEKIGLKKNDCLTAGSDENTVGNNLESCYRTGSPAIPYHAPSQPRQEFYDIFFMFTTTNAHTIRFVELCGRLGFKVQENMSEGVDISLPVHSAIQRILETSSHLVVLLTEEDCQKQEDNEVMMTVEMALQLAYSKGSLVGSVIPIRSCNKRKLPLLLQALIGAHIDDSTLEGSLRNSIDQSKRRGREEQQRQEQQD